MSGDLAALQGRWKVVSLEIAGAQMPVAMLPNAVMTVSGETFESSGMGAAYSGKIALSQAGGRKSFSLAFEEGPEKGNVNHGLYEFDGDAWTICLDTKGGPAPSDFVSTAANGYALERLTRIP
jgi:uncharacterized protein (TIGR03067 family)